VLKNKDVIVFSDDWGRYPFSCQHIMSRFLSDNRILWVNTIGMRNPRLTLYDLKRSLEKVRGWLTSPKGRVPQSENPAVIRPVVTPYGNLLPFRLRNRYSVIGKVRSTMRGLGMKNPIVVATLPNAADYVDAFDATMIVYYCVDEFTHWPGLDHSYVARLEERMLSKADLVFASAEELCDRKTRNGRRPFLLSHGVDYDHFAVAGEPAEERDRKVIGFFGAISPWIDCDLLVELAQLRTDWSFVFVGPTDIDVSSLAALPNVKLPGKMSYAELPRLASSFDVGLIPFRVNEMTVNVNPLKLLEYFALGLPVVSTRLPEVAKFGDLVYLADTAAGFASAIDRALAEDTAAMQFRRREAARCRSWDAVAEQFSAVIERRLAETRRIGEGFYRR
jgi:glycosyltransferase involved in cell wall biosynthesis